MRRRLILASASPRRRELLSLLGLPFEVVTSSVDEDSDAVLMREGVRASTIQPDRRAAALAWEKSLNVWLSRGDPLELILAADTLVITDRADVPTALGKPADPTDAARMLRLLSGTSHTVVTGVAL